MKKNLDNIKNNKLNTSKEKIKLKEESEKNIITIDFSFFYFPSISLKYFNNCFKDEGSYCKFMKDFYHGTLKYLKDKTYTDLEKNTHSHHIKDNDQIKIIRKILDEYIEKFPILPPIIDEMKEEFYQISTLSGGRIIGTRYGNTFCILFFDPHHLIYSDNRYNVDKTSYKSENIFYINNDIKIFDLEHLLENEKCLNCEVMDKLLSNKIEE